MKKSKLTGWKNVFSFTLTQEAKSKSFRSSTMLMALILLISMIGVNVFSAMKMDSKKSSENENVVESQENEETSKLEFYHTIYYRNETVVPIDVAQIESYINESYSNITFVPTDKSHDELVSEVKEQDETAYVAITQTEDGVEVGVYVANDRRFDKGTVETFATEVLNAVYAWKEATLGLSEAQSEFLNANVECVVVGDAQKSTAEIMVATYAPMALCLLLYMCIIMYGTMVGNSIANEKSSKVMELLLTSIRPLAIIVGKVLGMMTLALTQLMGNILIAVLGNKIGTIIGQQINPEYKNIVAEKLSEFNLLGIFSPGRLILALLVFILGFTFYCTLAGLMGATVNRGEDLASAMSVYSTAAMIGFFLAYMPNVITDGAKTIKTFTAIFPLSSPFILPAQLLVGEMSMTTIIIGLVVLLIVVVAFVAVVAKIYEVVILFNGNKVTLKDMRKFFHEARA